MIVAPGTMPGSSHPTGPAIWERPLTIGMAGSRPPLERYVAPEEIPLQPIGPARPFSPWGISTATAVGIAHVFRDTALAPGEQVRTASLLLMQERVVQQARGKRQEYLLSQLPNWFGTHLVLGGIAITSLVEIRDVMRRFLAETLQEVPTTLSSFKEYVAMKGEQGQFQLEHVRIYAKFDAIMSALLGAHVKFSDNLNAPNEYICVNPALFGLEPWNFSITMVEMHEVCHAVDRSVGPWTLRDSVQNARLMTEVLMPPVLDDCVGWIFNRQSEANAIGAQWELLQRIPDAYKIEWQRALLAQQQGVAVDESADWVDQVAAKKRRQWLDIIIPELLRANVAKEEFVKAGLALHGYAHPHVDAKKALTKGFMYAWGYLIFSSFS